MARAAHALDEGLDANARGVLTHAAPAHQAHGRFLGFFGLLRHDHPDRRPAVWAILWAAPDLGPGYGDLLRPASFGRLVLASISLGVALFGALAFLLPNFLGMRRRGLRASPVLLLAPVYLLLMSYASWRALWQWTRQPFVWTKTEHVPRRTGDHSAAARNLPASASAISARVLSTP